MLRYVPATLIVLTLTGCARKAEEASPVSSDEADKSEATAAAPPPKQGPPSSLASASPTAEATATPETVEKDTRLGAVSLPDLSACVTRCVEQNQMRAVAPEQIETDCQKTCHDECVSFCKDGQGDRPVGFADACRADCDKQRDRVTQKR